MLEQDSVPTPGVKLTYDDYVKFPDDGMRHELIDGVHYVAPCPNTGHQRIAGNLFGWIWSYLRAHPIGEVFGAPFDVILSNVDVVEPDLLYISAERARILTEKNVQGSPDLVVEVESPSTRKHDLGTKLRLYEQFDITEYWVISPTAKTVRVFRRSRNTLEQTLTLHRDSNDRLSTPLLPDFVLPLDELFRSTVAPR